MTIKEVENNFDIFDWLRDKVIKVSRIVYPDADISLLSNIAIEVPKSNNMGELSTNAAMIIASKYKHNPREIAEKILKEIELDQDNFTKIEIAGPGFINFTIDHKIWQKSLEEILKRKNKYGQKNIGNNSKVNIEFVSANPTGPMHIGHTRGAIYGDVLSKLMEFCGFDVSREYYVNDAGGQIDTLAHSVYLRYIEAVTNVPAEIPEGLYPGDYLVSVGKEIKKIYKNELIDVSSDIYLPKIKPIALKMMLDLIKEDLAQLGIFHNIFTSEQNLHDNNKILPAIERLRNSGLVYLGKLLPPKGAKKNEWLDREQYLFKATEFGDDQDRPLQKSDGSYTYFAADIAYAADKIERGFRRNIIILGFDHIGYVKRLEAIYKALSNNDSKVEIKLSHIVKFLKDGQPVKMSKRSGNFSTASEAIDEVGSSVLRFIMLTRKCDVPLDFDLNLVKQQTKENPIFYVQYGQVRAKSILENCRINLPEAYKIYSDSNYNLSLLKSATETKLIKLMAEWPKVLENACLTAELHKIPYYLQNLASEFHALWNLGKDSPDYRFILNNDIELTAARMALVTGVKDIIMVGLSLIGVEALEKM